jgi:hypothetical protein
LPALPSPGWVYTLTNPAMPRLVKIGLTTKTPKERAAELTAATGVPMPFKVRWSTSPLLPERPVPPRDRRSPARETQGRKAYPA